MTALRELVWPSAAAEAEHVSGAGPLSAETIAALEREASWCLDQARASRRAAELHRWDALREDAWRREGRWFGRTFRAREIAYDARGGLPHARRDRMTTRAFLALLVDLGVEALQRGCPGVHENGVACRAFERELRERMAQAATVYEFEVGR